MNCPTCTLEVREHEWHCPNCLTDLGAPNVRKASLPEEAAALDKRFDAAVLDLDARGVRAVGDKYLKALAGSVVVLCRGYADVLDLLKSENQTYASYHELVEAEKRRPGVEVINPDRREADAIFFPYYESSIRFAALSLDGLGAAHYGPVSMVLSASSIGTRCSFFEKNTVEFAREQNLGPGRPVPCGYRAPWKTRDRLAFSKGHTKIDAAVSPSKFPEILMEKDDFVEAHIFGPFHRRSIEQMNIRTPVRAADIAYVSEIRDVIARDALPIKVTMV
jgi:hypothetical protein